MTGDILKLVRDWLLELCDKPAMPDILVFCFALGKHRLCLEMKEADDALSSKALASTEVPSGA